MKTYWFSHIFKHCNYYKYIGLKGKGTCIISRKQLSMQFVNHHAAEMDAFIEIKRPGHILNNHLRVETLAVRKNSSYASQFYTSGCRTTFFCIGSSTLNSSCVYTVGLHKQLIEYAYNFKLWYKVIGWEVQQLDFLVLYRQLWDILYGTSKPAFIMYLHLWLEQEIY